MKEKELIDIWKREESVAHIHGWDFSHIEGRYTEETPLKRRCARERRWSAFS